MPYAAGDRLFAADLLDLPFAWPTWTPTLTNLTLGNGVVTARRRVVGKTCDWRFKFKLGSTSAVGTGPAFTLPFTPHGSYAAPEDLMGSALLLDAGTAQRFGSVRFLSGSTVEFVSYSTTGVVTAISATVPHTWAVNDTLAAFGTFELA